MTGKRLRESRGTLWPIAVLCLVLGMAIGQAQQDDARSETPKINGHWSARVGAKTYTLNLRFDQGDLLGSVRLPNGKTVEITDGICVTDEFSFTTIEDGVEWEWTGTIGESGLEGERLRVDNESTEPFTAQHSGA